MVSEGAPRLASCMPLLPVPVGTEPVELVPLWPVVSPELCPAMPPELCPVVLTLLCSALHPAATKASNGQIVLLRL